mgnify:CR=1 FL=1|tara:strand:+ start:764 stop:1108 length:345 start_codon:yes stop_codon:yes gene_type:complete
MKQDLYQYNEEWEHDDPKIKEELMMIAHNIDPYSGNRIITKNTINWESRNSLYTYRRTINDAPDDNPPSWVVGLHPSGMSADTYYDPPKYEYTVMMPEEFLNTELFMKINIGDL